MPSAPARKYEFAGNSFALFGEPQQGLVVPTTSGSLREVCQTYIHCGDP